MQGLERFVEAQDDHWDSVTSELRAGRKETHWIWYVFPQLRGLGSSSTSRLYALEGLDEARAYLAHPVLGPRLESAALLMLAHAGRRPEDILGGIDARKLRSSMTVFEAADPKRPLFARMLDTFYMGERCPLTLGLLSRPPA